MSFYISSVTWSFITISAITAAVYFGRDVLCVLYDRYSTNVGFSFPLHWSSKHCPFQIPVPNNKSHSLPFAPFTSRSFVTVPRFHKALIFTFWWLPHLQLWLAVPFHKLFWVLHLSSWDIRVSTLTKTASLLFLISHTRFMRSLSMILSGSSSGIMLELHMSEFVV